MDQIKLLNFADFFFNISKEELDEEFLDFGETSGNSEDEHFAILELIRKKQAELKLAEGRKFREAYISKLNKNIESSRDKKSETESNVYHIAARKSIVTEIGIEADKVKLDLIKKLVKRQTKK